MADTETVKKSVLLTGIDELSPKLAGLVSKVDSFKKNLEQAGLGKLDISGLFKGGSVITPFVDGIKASDAFRGKLTEVSEAAKGVDLPNVPQSATQSMNVFSDSMSKVSASIDTALAPAVGALVVGLEPLLTGVGRLMADNPKLVETLAIAAIAFSTMQTAVTGATQVLDVMSTVLKTSPIMLIAMGVALAAGLIIANWTPISAFFVNLWAGVKNVAAKAMAVLSTHFSWTPLGMLINNWGPVTRFLAGIWEGIKAVVGTLVDFLKEAFSWTPLGMIIDNWAGVTGLFSAIWELLKALTVPVIDFLKGVFDWTPLGIIINNWQPITEVFSALWGVVQALAAPVLDFLKGMFEWSPLGQIIKNWEPITEWFSGLWKKLQDVIAPIKELFEGGFAGVIARVTGKVEGLAEAQKHTNTEGKGELAPAFFGANTERSASPLTGSASSAQSPSMLAGSLTQNSSALIQQSAANNRTQLEGGLTVRFENAPAGLRTDQPQTNQPALMLNSRIGYRSLSLGGSNELA